MRDKWLKIAGLVLAIVAVLVIAAFVLAKTLITPERVRSVVLSVAEDSLHRPVDLEEIEIGLFSGISCRGLAIGEQEGQGNFIEAEALELRYRFWPLLFGRVVIDEASLERPVIRLGRDGEGRFNFADLLDQSAAGQGEATSRDHQSDSPIDLLVTRLTIDKGKVEFVDQAVHPDRALVTRLDGFSLAASKVSLDRGFPVELAFELNGAPMKWRGTVDAARKAFVGQLQIDGLAVTPLIPYMAEALPGKLRALEIAADLEIDANPRKVTSRGTVDLTRVAMTLEALPDAPIEDAQLKLDHDLTVDFHEKRLALRSLRVQYNRIVLEAQEGSIDTGDPVQVKVDLLLPNLTAGDLVASLPSAMAEKIAAFEPSGQVEGRLSLAGPFSDLATLIKDGSVVCKELGGRVGHLEPRLSGTVHLDTNELSAEKMQLKMAGNPFSLDASAQGLFSPVTIVSTALRSESVDFDALLPAGKKDGNPLSGDRAPREEGEGMPLDLPLEMRGEVLIATGRYKGLDLKDLRLDWRLTDNIVRLDELNVEAASGTLRGKSVVDLGRRKTAYDANLQVEDVDANALVSALAPRAADTVFGRLDLSLNLRGEGTQPRNLKQNLVGGGGFTILEGQLTGAGIMQELGAFLDMGDLRVFRFGRGEGTFNIRDGNVFLEASFAGSKARLLPEGRIGFDRSLDLSIKTYLSPENTKKLAGRGMLGEVIADEKGWGLVPLKVSGSLGDPAFAVDRQALTQQVKEGGKRKLKEKLREKILEETGEPSKEGEGDPAKKLLEDTLRGLLGN